eukprot:3598018-Ditylum_brightwellii.AAC.1
MEDSTDHVGNPTHDDCNDLEMNSTEPVSQKENDMSDKHNSLLAESDASMDIIDPNNAVESTGSTSTEKCAESCQQQTEQDKDKISAPEEGQPVDNTVTENENREEALHNSVCHKPCDEKEGEETTQEPVESIKHSSPNQDGIDMNNHKETFFLQKQQLVKENIALKKKLQYLLTNPSSSSSSISPMLDTNLNDEAQLKANTNLNETQMEHMYKIALVDFAKVNNALNQQRAEYDKDVKELQGRLKAKEKKAGDIFATFQHFRQTIAMGNSNMDDGGGDNEEENEEDDSKKKKKNPKDPKQNLILKQIKELEAIEKQQNEDIEKSRLKNITLRDDVKKLEKKIRFTEKLAGGLDLIDFEQLQVENKSLSSTITTLEEEVKRSKEKNSSCVTIISHLQQKVCASQKLILSTQASLEEMNRNIVTYKCELNHLNQEKEEIKKKKDASHKLN